MRHPPREPSHASRIATRTRDTRSAERIGGGAMVGDYTVILIMILALTALGLTLLSLVIAILFVIFDIEAIFLYPWAVAFNQLGLYGLLEMVSFIAILLVGYVYAWRKGALEWV